MLPQLVIATAFCAVSLFVPASSAQVPVRLEQCAGGLLNPTDVTAPLGDDRLFVTEQLDGRVRIVDGAGTLLPTPFLQLGPNFVSGGERGLLGLAFHPDYELNGQFFVTYTDADGWLVLSRFLRSPTSADLALANSETVLLRLEQPFLVHKGADLDFGPDGYLYVTIGDGGGSGDGTCRPQNLGSLLGKVLRLDVDTIDGHGRYAIPSSNPFVGVPGARGEIWHLGLRNPWRFCIDPLSGDMWIGDVGESTTEEINWARANESGVNFGWKIMEGANCFVSPGCNGVNFLPCGHPSLRLPLTSYSHSFGCAVIGGQVYRGDAIPAMQGMYVYADFCSARVWAVEGYEGQLVSSIELTAQLQASAGFSSPSAIGRDGFGELVLATVGGCLYRFVPDTTSTTPVASLIGDVDSISIAAGGVQQLQLIGGASRAGQIYFMSGTASGTHPGLPIEGQLLPLQPDVYTLYLLDTSIAPPLAPILGVLDGNGNASAQFSLAPGAAPSDFAGITFHHMFVTFDATFAFDFASNAESIALNP